MTDWGENTIDNKTEWNKRQPYKGPNSGIGVPDSRFHLGDDKSFTFGYDSDWIIQYSTDVATNNVLLIGHDDLDINNAFFPDGKWLIAPQMVAPTTITTGSIANIYADFGDSGSSFQLHQAKGTSSWVKILNQGDIITSSSFSGNNNDTSAIPTVKAVKDAILTAGVSNTIEGATDTDIDTPNLGNLMLYDTADSRWHNKAMRGVVTLSEDGVTTIQNNVVTFDAMIDATGTDKVIGRSSAGSGSFEEITCTSVGRTLIGAASLN